MSDAPVPPCLAPAGLLATLIANRGRSVHVGRRAVLRERALAK